MAELKQGSNTFYLETNGERKAEISFTRQDESLIIDSTYVSEELRGKGTGRELVHNVVELARAENKTIIPKCSYAEKVLKETSKYHDVLEPL
ncbi:GNAT family N-acetyltransferase [Alteribacillus sp. HJP-4]|uniref:GNAT family N-acetyltransferase n=1 Tax=Alteribacillus sp. HJP-4 TaxID=2775394 RepID=UPI0035CCCD33